MKKVKIVASKDALQADYNKVENLHFEKGQCLENAKMVSKIIENCDIVEGIVECSDRLFIRHAWNIIHHDNSEDVYFDMTAESINVGNAFNCYIVIDTFNIDSYKTIADQTFISDSAILSNCANAFREINMPNATINDIVFRALPESDCSSTIRKPYANEKCPTICLSKIIKEVYKKDPVNVERYIGEIFDLTRNNKI